MNNLSRLKAIHAFEVTARLGSYVAAALELNVTPAAVGQQVRSLEQWLGIPLFERHSSGEQRLKVSEHAQTALTCFGEGLRSIEDGVTKLREKHTQKLVTVSASQAFATKWLMPRLEHFYQNTSHKIDLRVDVTDRLVNLHAERIDIAIRCGNGRWADLSTTHLMNEMIIPVCSPALFKRLSLHKLSSLSKAPLIHDTSLTNTKIFPTWSQWFTRAGIEPSTANGGIKINSPSAVIQAAACDQGVALVRSALVAEDLKKQHLVRLFPKIEWPISWAYYAAYEQNALSKQAVRIFHDWLTEQVVGTHGNP